MDDCISISVDDVEFSKIDDYMLDFCNEQIDLVVLIDFFNSNVVDVEEYMSEILTSVGSDDDFFVTVSKTMKELTKEQVKYAEFVDKNTKGEDIIIYQDTFSLQRATISCKKMRLFFVKKW